MRSLKRLMELAEICLDCWRAGLEAVVLMFADPDPVGHLGF